MKFKKIYLIFSLFIACSSNAQIAGTLDLSFGTGGEVIKSINTGLDVGYGVKVLSNGSYLTAGTTYSSSTGNDFFCTKFLSNGMVDVAFGINGIFKNDI